MCPQCVTFELLHMGSKVMIHVLMMEGIAELSDCILLLTPPWPCDHHMGGGGHGCSWFQLCANKRCTSDTLRSVACLLPGLFPTLNLSWPSSFSRIRLLIELFMISALHVASCGGSIELDQKYIIMWTHQVKMGHFLLEIMVLYLKVALKSWHFYINI